MHAFETWKQQPQHFHNDHLYCEETVVRNQKLERLNRTELCLFRTVPVIGVVCRSESDRPGGSSGICLVVSAVTVPALPVAAQLAAAPQDARCTG